MYNKLKDLNVEIIKDEIKSSYSFDELFRKLKVCPSPQNRRLIKNLYSVDHFDACFYRKQNAKYKSVTKKCPVCDTEFTCRDSGKDYKATCSCKCSSLYFKRMSPEIAIKISKTLKKQHELKLIEKGTPINRQYTCEQCNNKFLIKYTKNNKRRFCSNKCAAIHKSNDINIRSKLSLKQKLNVANGTHKGWQTRNVLSYPERYFKKILEDLSLRFTINHPVSKTSLGVNCASCYFLDFFFEDKKVDLEIDGKQHERTENATSDKIRDVLLKTNGYNIFRIKWYNPTNENNKNLLYGQFQNFLKWYEELPLV